MNFKGLLSRKSLVKRVASVTFFSLVLVTSFQNCGKAGFDSELKDSVLDSSSTATSASLISKYGQLYGPKVQAIPFAFDADVDQITYNSCFGTAYQKKAGAFTFKVGAYGANSGLKLLQSYHDYVTNNFKATYPNTSITTDEKKAYLYDSPVNQGLKLQFAWRNYAQPYWVRNHQSPKSGVDYIDYDLAVTDDRIMTPLFETSTANYFGLAPEENQKRVEYSIFYNQTEAWADYFRRDMTVVGNDGQRGILALTFKTTSGEAYEPARSDSTSTKIAYGRGYTFTFGKPGSVPAANNPDNVLTGVSEVNLASTTKPILSSTWSCPESLRLIIVRPSDAATYCPGQSITSASSTTHLERLKIIRRHLPASQWDVNTELNCAVPKGFDCYTNETYNGALVPVQYDNSLECFENIENKSYTSSAPVNVCSQYISVCLK